MLKTMPVVKVWQLADAVGGVDQDDLKQIMENIRDAYQLWVGSACVKLIYEMLSIVI